MRRRWRIESTLQCFVTAARRLVLGSLFRTRFMSEKSIANFNKRHDEFLRLIGLCITAWSRIEAMLFDLCQHALGASSQATAIVFYRTPTLDTRINLCDELLRTILPTPERKNGGHEHMLAGEWRRIKKTLQDLMPERNFMAHKGIMHDADPIIVEIGANRARIMNPNRKTWFELHLGNEKMRPVDKRITNLKIGDLKRHHAEVKKAFERLIAFEGGVLAMRPATPPQPPAPQSSETRSHRSSQTRRKRRPRSSQA
jgi:hypothetical protein